MMWARRLLLGCLVLAMIALLAPAPVATGPSPEGSSFARGEGLLVAVLDSGVAGDGLELVGRVAAGVDVRAGRGSADTDPIGSGTAMARVIAGAPVGRSKGEVVRVAGLAPAATILPLRVVGNLGESDDPRVIAQGIVAATKLRADVIAVGPYVDLSAQVVLEAVNDAVAHDVVVIGPAPAASAAGGSIASGDERPGVLRVGGAGVDGLPAVSYRPGNVDLLAPSIDGVSARASGGLHGVGCVSRHAVAYVAGVATLLRSTTPGLTAAEVVRRLLVTARRPVGLVAPDTAAGWGLVDPGAAMTAANKPAPASDSKPVGPSQILAIGVVVVAALIGTALLADRKDTGPARGSPPR